MTGAGIISSTGLGLDIMGVVLVFIYGLPSRVVRIPGTRLIWGGSEESKKAEIAEYRHYERMSYIGMGLLVFGFSLQLVSNFFN